MMTNEEWKNSNDAVEMLESLKGIADGYLIENTALIHSFYIGCCRDHLHIWPDKNFVEALIFLEKYRLDETRREELHKHDYHVESSIFRLQYSPETEESKAIIERVVKITNLSEKEALAYAVSFGYFVNWALLYAGSWKGEIPYKYRSFLSPELLKNSIYPKFID